MKKLEAIEALLMSNRIKFIFQEQSHAAKMNEFTLFRTDRAGVRREATAIAVKKVIDALLVPE